MDRQPVLEGERLLLRPLLPADWDGFNAAGGDPAVWAGHPCSDRWEDPNFRAFFQDALDKGGALAVIEKAAVTGKAPGIDTAEGRIIGSSRFQGYAPENSQVEIGWTFLAPSHWGGTYNREMKRLMLIHALQFVERVTFRVGEGNIRSRKAMAKIGGVLTDEIQIVEYQGQSLPHVIFEITRDSFATGPLAEA